MGRIITLIYGVGSYAAFFLTFLYAIGFLGNVLVPKSLDSGPIGPLGTALLVDMGLLALFAVQHSVMARPAFKRLLTTVVSPAAERSTYVLASSLALILLFWQWHPLGGVVWEVEQPVGRALLYGGFALRLGARPRDHVRHQPLRPVRPPANVAALPGTSRRNHCDSSRRSSTASCGTRSTWDGCWRSGARRR